VWGCRKVGKFDFCRKSVIFDVIVGVVAGPMTSIGQFPTNVGTLGSVGAKYEVSSYSGSGSLIRRGMGPKVFFGKFMFLGCSVQQGTKLFSVEWNGPKFCIKNIEGPLNTWMSR
jgi:hypothetical protein